MYPAIVSLEYSQVSAALVGSLCSLERESRKSYDARKKTSFCRPVFTACEIKKEKRQEKGRVKKLALAAAAAM